MTKKMIMANESDYPSRAFGLSDDDKIYVWHNFGSETPDKKNFQDLTTDIRSWNTVFTSVQNRTSETKKH